MHRFLLAVCVLFLSTGLFAQDKPQAKTTADAKIKIVQLEKALKPLQEPQLKIETEGWIALFAAAAQGIADAADGTDLTPMVQARDALKSRAETVLKAWRNKGGDKDVIANHELYLSQASGLEIDATDVNAVWTYVSDWATNEEGGIALGINILKFLLTLFVFRILSRIAGKIVSKVVGRMKNASDLLKKFAVNFATKFTMFIGLVVALTMLGVDVTPFLAVIGAAGFIIGFALQGTLNNFAAGIMILIYRPFDVGDVITAAGITAKVDAMTMSSTTVKTPDNQIIIIPNGKIWGDIITNVTGSDTRRVDLVFGIGYDDDIQKAQKLLEEITAAHPLVLKDPAPVVKVHELADSSVNFVCRPWSKTGDYWDVYWDLTRTVKERFDKEQISIPYPQTDVHVHQVGS